VSDRLPAVLHAYRLFSMAATPFTALLLERRLRRGKEHRLRLPERRGLSVMARPPGPLVWLHGASIGELISVLPLIERIHASEVSVLVTSGTVSSGGLAKQRLPRGVIHQFVPLDVPMFVRRFLDHWQPDLALFVESDLWPNIMIETSRRGVPMMLINGRLSENSFRRWRYLPVTIGDLLRRLDLCLARTPADAQRFGDLGAPRVVTTGDLKLDGPAPPADRVKLAALQSAVAGRPIIAAASTHAGEETAMIDAHRRLRTNFLSLLTLIAPRHPERGVGVGDIARAAGLRVRLRSRGELPDATTDVYVADTFGELGLIYRLAPIVFVGGSLVKHGGQNPIEPAKLGAAILHGPHVWNFAEIYAALDQAHGAEPVADASKLTASFGTLLTQAEARSRIADAARTTVEALGGGLERTLKSLDPYLMQLRLRQRADNA
jgi:3-deoxy-D-manno-octulosonic-acid transferase